jgi:hypothetical protein
MVRQEQFREKNFQSLLPQMKLCRFLLLRLAVDCIPEAFARITHSSHQPLDSREHSRSNDSATLKSGFFQGANGFRVVERIKKSDTVCGAAGLSL